MSSTDTQHLAETARLWGDALSLHALEYPDEHVVRFLAANRAAGHPNGAALDVGFGSGRHLAALLRFGHLPSCGLEISEDAKATAEAMLAGAADHLDLRLATPLDRPWPNGTFGTIVDWGTSFLARRADMHAHFAALHAMARPGARLLVNARPPENWFFGLGEALEPGTWLLDERAGPYAGMTYGFCTEAESREILESNGWRVDVAERYEWWKHRAADPSHREHHVWNIFRCERI